MVGIETGATIATKLQVRHDLHKSLIYAYSASSYLIEESLFLVVVCCENICGKRLNKIRVLFFEHRDKHWQALLMHNIEERAKCFIEQQLVNACCLIYGEWEKSHNFLLFYLLVDLIPICRHVVANKGCNCFISLCVFDYFLQFIVFLFCFNHAYVLLAPSIIFHDELLKGL